MDLKQMLSNSLVNAQALMEEDKPGAQLHRKHSENWINALAEQFQGEYPLRSNFRVFWKDNPGNRSDFGLNEFLYDISVCEVTSVELVLQGKQLTFVRNAIWQVEFEFAKDSRQALFDFSKLVVGSGQNKLFISPQVSKEDEFLRVLREPASFCTGTVYLSMVPHPREWKIASSDIKLWRMKDGIWVEE